jgi:hypothetical protein
MENAGYMELAYLPQKFMHDLSRTFDSVVHPGLRFFVET